MEVCLIRVELVRFSYDHTDWRFLSPLPPLVKWTALFTSTHDNRSSNGGDYAEDENNNSRCISKKFSINVPRVNVSIFEYFIVVNDASRAGPWFITAISTFINSVAVK